VPDRLVDADENDLCMKVLVLERSLGGPWGCLGVSGGPWGGLWGSWGDPGEEEKRRRFSGGVLGWSWEPLGVVLEVWGDPWVSPGRSDCCYFVGVSRLSEVVCV